MSKIYLLTKEECPIVTCPACVANSRFIHNTLENFDKGASQEQCEQTVAAYRAEADPTVHTYAEGCAIRKGTRPKKKIVKI